MATRNKQPQVGAPRREDSRAGKLRAMRKGATLTAETLLVDSLELVSAGKRKLNSVWSRAAGMVRQQEGRSFSITTEAQTTIGGQVEITIFLKRTV